MPSVTNKEKDISELLDLVCAVEVLDEYTATEGGYRSAETIVELMTNCGRGVRTINGMKHVLMNAFNKGDMERVKVGTNPAKASYWYRKTKKEKT